MPIVRHFDYNSKLITKPGIPFHFPATVITTGTAANPVVIKTIMKKRFLPVLLYEKDDKAVKLLHVNQKYETQS